jgi:hypothetical protein
VTDTEEYLIVEPNTLVFYVDDSGDERLNDQGHPIFAFGGVACTHEFHLDLARSWQTMKAKVFPQIRGPLHAKTHLRDGKLAQAKRDAVLAAMSHYALGRFGTIITSATIVAPEKIIPTASLTLGNRLGHIAGGMIQLGLWNPKLPSRKAVAVFEHSARLSRHIERHFTNSAVKVHGLDVPIEGCFMPKGIANPFLEMADFVVNTIARNVKYQIEHGRECCMFNFQRLFRDVGPPLADYIEVTQAI